jgi:hypothetical protein
MRDLKLKALALEVLEAKVNGRSSMLLSKIFFLDLFLMNLNIHCEEQWREWVNEDRLDGCCCSYQETVYSRPDEIELYNHGVKARNGVLRITEWIIFFV